MSASSWRSRGIDRAAARDLLVKASGVVKTAIVMSLLGVDREAAEKQLTDKRRRHSPHRDRHEPPPIIQQ